LEKFYPFQSTERLCDWSVNLVAVFDSDHAAAINIQIKNFCSELWEGGTGEGKEREGKRPFESPAAFPAGRIFHQHLCFVAFPGENPLPQPKGLRGKVAW